MRIFLKPRKARPFWYGHPLVFSGAIERVEGNPQAGELVTVCDHEGQAVGIGAFNPYSSYRVRLLARTQESLPTDFTGLIQHRLQQAFDLRQQLQLPNSATDAYRLFNSEGDGLSGLTIDVYGHYAVVAVSAYWAAQRRDDIEMALKKLLPDIILLWRPVRKVLLQDGWKELNEETTVPEEKIETIIRESGLIYRISLTHGQKTGHYFDQRANRLVVRHLAKNRKVLDLFCYNGGFSLNAAVGGALSVTGVDSSQPAIQHAQENARLNHLDERVEFCHGDAMDVLQHSPDTDFIILDPPKIAPSRKHLDRASRYYQRLNQLAMAALPKNGLLLTCTCSGAMLPDYFLNILHESAFHTRRSITVINIYRADVDHPVLSGFEEGDYLHAVLVAVR